MHRTAQSVLVSALLLAGIAGCPAGPTVEPCNNDETCGVGRYCGSAGVGCTFDCRVDIDCTGGTTCDARRGRCIGGADGGVPRDAATVCQNHADCDDGVFCNGPERCTPGAAGVPADGCAPAVSPCSSGAMCDEVADACRTNCDEDTDANGRPDRDNDNDGHDSIACDGDDCDDTDGDRYPRTLAEVCDPLAPAHDEDCSPCTVASYVAGDGDRDDDGYYSSACSNPIPTDVDLGTFACPVTVASIVSVERDSRLVTGTDCNDDPTTGRDVHPSEGEMCNGIDDNCSGTVDEGVGVSVYLDCDGDMRGDPASARTGCPDEEARPEDACSGAGRWRIDSGDPMGCDFGSGAAMRHRDAPETCNGVDDNCEGNIDEGDPGGGAACSPPGRPGSRCGGVLHCQGEALACVQNDLSFPRAETCNNIDDDCNGTVDTITEPCASTCGVGSAGTRSCSSGTWGNCSATSAMRPCTDACGSAMQTCTGGSWLACPTPRTRPCTVACGSSGSTSCNPSTGWNPACTLDTYVSRACSSCGGWQPGREPCEASGWGTCSAPTSGFWGGLSYGECAVASWPFGDHVCSGGSRYCQSSLGEWRLNGAAMGNDCGSADGSAWYVPASQDSFCNVGWFGGALPQGNYEITWDIGGGGGGAVGMWVDSRGVSDPVTDVRVGPGRRTIVGHWNNSGTLPISPSFYIVYRGSIWQDWMRIYSVTIRRTS